VARPRTATSSATVEPATRSSRWAAALTRKPNLLSAAIRTTVLVGVGFGAHIGPEAVAAIGICVEAWTALFTAVYSVATSEVAAQMEGLAAMAEEGV
jgi:hypothetical protein